MSKYLQISSIMFFVALLCFCLYLYFIIKKVCFYFYDVKSVKTMH